MQRDLDDGPHPARVTAAQVPSLREHGGEVGRVFGVERAAKQTRDERRDEPLRAGRLAERARVTPGERVDAGGVLRRGEREVVRDAVERVGERRERGGAVIPRIARGRQRVRGQRKAEHVANGVGIREARQAPQRCRRHAGADLGRASRAGPPSPSAPSPSPSRAPSLPPVAAPSIGAPASISPSVVAPASIGTPASLPPPTAPSVPGKTAPSRGGRADRLPHAAPASTEAITSTTTWLTEFRTCLRVGPGHVLLAAALENCRKKSAAPARAHRAD